MFKINSQANTKHLEDQMGILVHLWRNGLQSAVADYNLDYEEVLIIQPNFT